MYSLRHLPLTHAIGQAVKPLEKLTGVRVVDLAHRNSKGSVSLSHFTASLSTWLLKNQGGCHHDATTDATTVGWTKERMSQLWQVRTFLDLHLILFLGIVAVC